MSTLREFHDIIYRSLFDMDTRALLIYFNLPPDCYYDEEDDELLDSMGTLALQAISEIHQAQTVWLSLKPLKSVTAAKAKDMLRDLSIIYATKYKKRAEELGENLLTTMRTK